MLGLQAPQQPLPSAERVSEVMREVVADPDFVTFGESPRQALIRWVLDVLDEFWRWLRRLVGGDGGVAAEIVVIVVALAALLIMVRIGTKHAGVLRRAGGEEEEEEEPEPATAQEWLGIAARRADKGAFRRAATALYQGFLLSLDQQGALSFHSSKTPGDYAREIARGGVGGGGAGAGGRFLGSFQGYSFGMEEPTPEGYAELATMARRAGCAVDGSSGNADSEAPDA